MASRTEIVLVATMLIMLSIYDGPAAFCQPGAPASEAVQTVKPELYAPGAKCDEGEYNVPGMPDFEAKLHELNCKILQQEIDFARFNIRFRQNGNVQGRWRGLRYFASQETNSLMTVAGLTGQIVARERSIANTTRSVNKDTGQVTARVRPVNRAAVQRATACQMIGQQIASLGSATELAINVYHQRQAKKNGWDDKTALRKAAAMRAQLKTLLSERSQLVESAAMLPTQKEVLRLGGEVMSDICNLTFDEYRRAHIGNARFRTFQNSLFVGDFSKSSVGWVGNLLGIISQSRQNPKLGGPNGLCVGISGALIAANPIVSRSLGKLREMYERKRLNREFGNSEKQDLDDFDRDRAELRAALAKHNQTSSNPVTACEERLTLYEVEDASREKQEDLALREIRAGQRTATQNIVSAQIVGDTKLANGITQFMAGFEFPNNQRASAPLIVDGQIAYLAGSSYGAADNIRIQVQAELRRRRLKRQRLLPNQVYQDRMKALESLERVVQQN